MTAQKLTKKERELFEPAKSQGFLVTPKLKRHNLTNEWWRHCTVNEIPYVVVQKAAKEAQVRIDLMPARFRFTERDEPEDGILRLYKKYIGRRSKLAWGGEVAYFYRIPVDNAETLAQEALEYLATPGATHPVPTREDWLLGGEEGDG